LAYADAVLADSPLGYWKLDEASGTTCADSSGNGRDLTYGGTPNFRNSGPPIVGGASYAVGLNGVNGEGATASYASWMLPTSFSLECWVRSTASSGYPAIFGVANGRADSGQFILYIRSGTIKATFTNTFAASSEVTTGSGMTDGNWRHVVVTHDSSSGDFILYINGSSVASNSRIGTPQSVSQPISIGGCGSTTDSNWFSGDIAHCAYYGAALPAARVLAHYDAASGITLAGAAVASAAVTGNLVETGLNLGGTAGVVASATGAIQMAQSLIADAISRASALGHMPTPGPGFGCWTRSAWPFARYIGRAISFGYRPYYDEASALAGTAQAATTATGDLNLTVIGIAGNAIVQVAVVGDLGINMAEALGGGAVVSSTVTGNLQTDNISGAAAGLVTATGQTGIATPLSAAAVTRAIAAGTPSVLVPLGATAQVINAVTGALLGAVPIASDADGVASATAVVNMLQSFTGSAAARAAAVASLTIGASMSGAAAAVGTVTGALGVGVDLDGDAQARASASGATGVSTSLAGQAVSQAALTGTLKDISTSADGPCYAVNLATGAATTLSNFGFEKLSRAHAALYGLKSGTVYQLTGDTDPGPTNIDATIRLSPMVMPTMYLHRLHYMYIRAREVDGITAIPVYDETVGYRYDTAADARGGLRVTKVNTGNGNSWHSLGLIVKNKNGGKLDLAGVEFVINQLVRRTK
jgi:hypothetical protein